MIDENQSVFRIDEFLQKRQTFFKAQSRVEKTICRLVPSISMNVTSVRNLRGFVQRVRALRTRARVLIVGAGDGGAGLSLADFTDIDVIESDVAWGHRTQLICDAHALPFRSGVLDGCIFQAVLEHVMDPHKCVAEGHRVLADGGLVYAETPFMQQVHGGPYDFWRFTHSGHRRLFRFFQEIESGVCCGPGMALAWAIRYFLVSPFRSTLSRGLATALAAYFTFWLKYCDYGLVYAPRAFDAASGFYFLGKRAQEPVSDRDLLDYYRS